MQEKQRQKGKSAILDHIQGSNFSLIMTMTAMTNMA